jgi:hypothetical protein
MVTIPARFNGPATSGNGGWVCGLLADEWARRHGAGVVTSTLLQPPPLDSPLIWEPQADLELHLLTAGGAIIGTAVPGSFVDDPAPRVTPEDAAAGYDAFLGHEKHPFERCFTCGTARGEGDGLRLFTGPIDEARTAAPWTVHEAFADDDGQVPHPIAWAALDCPGGWAGGFPEDVLLLGRMTAEVMRPPTSGETLLATGWLRNQDGRKRNTSTALYTPEGDLVGRSEQVWITIP